MWPMQITYIGCGAGSCVGSLSNSCWNWQLFFDHHFHFRFIILDFWAEQPPGFRHIQSNIRPLHIAVLHLHGNFFVKTNWNQMKLDNTILLPKSMFCSFVSFRINLAGGGLYMALSFESLCFLGCFSSPGDALVAAVSILTKKNEIIQPIRDKDEQWQAIDNWRLTFADFPLGKWIWSTQLSGAGHHSR